MPLRLAASLFTVSLFATAASPSPETCSGSPALARVTSPCQHYSLKLSALYSPQSPSAGLLLKARIDGGPPLLFILDSGADFVVLDRRQSNARSRFGILQPGRVLDLVGFGSSPKTARQISGGMLEIGNLVFQDCPMLGLDTRLPEGIDGIIPLSLFAGFVVRLNVPAKTLDLEPYPPGHQVRESGDLPALVGNRLLFVEGSLNDSRTGYMLLDTGSSFSVVSPAAAGAWKNYRSLSPDVALRGGSGETDGFLLPAGVRFHLGSRVLRADPAVVVDLSDFARHHDFALLGVMGYPALRSSIMTINYRDSLVRFEGK